jgi:hypothetical protein
VELVVREFLLAWAICVSPYGKSISTKPSLVKPKNPQEGTFSGKEIVYLFNQI